MCWREGAPTKWRESDSSLEWGSQGALHQGPARVTLLEQWPWGWTPGPLLPGCSLLGAALSALGRTAVVSDKAAKAHGHGRVTVIHGHHGHLLSRRPVGQAQAADVGLLEEKHRRRQRVLPPVPSADVPAPALAPPTGSGDTEGRQADQGQGASPQPHFTLVPQTICTGLIVYPPNLCPSQNLGTWPYLEAGDLQM